MVNSILPDALAQQEHDEYELFGRAPKGFNPRDPNRIQTFSERLRNLRTDRKRIFQKQISEHRENSSDIQKECAESKENPAMDPQSFLRAKDLASELGVTPMMISKYENGKIKSIPMDRIRRICAFYGVSPHYLLGYVDGETDYLRMDKDGNILRNEKGEARILHSGMQFSTASFVQAEEAYKNLYMESNKMFWIIYKIISSPAEKLSKYEKVLDALIGLA